MRSARLRSVLVLSALLSLAACTSAAAPVSQPAIPVAPTSLPVSTSAAPVKGTLLWSDDFGGAAGSAPDPSKWSQQVGGGGWGNQELECYTDSRQNSALDGNGHLVITAVRDPGHRCADGNVDEYTSARLTTQYHFSARYGRIEMYAQVPTAPGAWPALWSMGTDLPQVNWPEAGEIDVAEVGGNLPTTIHGTVHGPATAGGPQAVTRTHDTGANLSTGFHRFAVDWSPDSLTWYIDGEPYGTVSRGDVEANGRWVFSHPFFLLLNLAVGGTFPGAPGSQSDWPQQLVVDYVRVYA